MNMPANISEPLASQPSAVGDARELSRTQRDVTLPSNAAVARDAEAIHDAAAQLTFIIIFIFPSYNAYSLASSGTLPTNMTIADRREAL